MRRAGDHAVPPLEVRRGQYYIFHADQTGLALLAEMLAAADRGVRVRLLLDDIHTKGQDDALAAVDAHPNAEVRLFNPFANRSARWIDLASDFGRVNRRMHNKSMTADNQATIVGGRNIGDEYFQANEHLNFSDLDLLAFGPIVPQVSAVFDQYWNSEEVYPLTAMRRGKALSEADIRKLRDELSRRTEALRGTAYAAGLSETGLAQTIAAGRIPLYWGKATVIADEPTKVRKPPGDSSTHAIPKLADYLSQAKQELLLVSPYFVPGKNGAKFLTGIASRGVRVTILTNSFAATDVAVVHAGYSPYRMQLLQAGIELYELKPTAQTAQARRKGHTGSSGASLHAKTYMVDRRELFVGSLNLDPRSARLNTEMGIVVESAELCAELRSRLDEGLLDGAYRVELIRGEGPNAPDRLVWITRESGQEKRYDREPGMGMLQGIGQGIMRILPVEAQL
jgi:putative cardiolipin synthase